MTSINTVVLPLDQVQFKISFVVRMTSKFREAIDVFNTNVYILTLPHAHPQFTKISWRPMAAKSAPYISSIVLCEVIHDWLDCIDIVIHSCIHLLREPSAVFEAFYLFI